MVWPFHPESRGRLVESKNQSFAVAMERKRPKTMEKGDPQRDWRPSVPLRGSAVLPSPWPNAFIAAQERLGLPF